MRACKNVPPPAGAAMMLFAAFFWASAALAEEPGAQEVPPAPEVPVVVPADDILVRSAQEEQNLRRLDALMAPHLQILAIDAALDELAPVVLELRADLDALDPERASRRVLNDYRYRWSELQILLRTWRSAVDARSETFTNERAAIIHAQDVWLRTLASARADVDVLPDSIQRAEALLVSLEQARSELRRERDGLAVVLDRVVTEQRIAEDALARLADHSSRARQRVLVRDAPALWNRAAFRAGSLSSDTLEATQYWWETLAAFARDRRGSLFAQLALFLIFVVGTFRMRGLNADWPADDVRFDIARHLVTRPISTALAFALVSSTLLRRSDAVSAYFDVIMVASFIPVLRLGVGIVDYSVRPVVYGILGLFAASRFVYLAPDGSLLERVLLLATTAAALAASMVLIRSYRRRDASRRTGWWRLGIGLTWIAGGILAVSLLANVLGWLSLATLLFEGVMGGAYSAIAWIVFTKAATGILPVLARGSIGDLVHSIRRREDAFARNIGFGLSGLALLFWTRSVLMAFQILEPTRRWLADTLSSSWILGGLNLSLGRILGAVGILLFTYVLAKLVRVVLQEDVLPRFSLPRGAANSVVTLANYLIVGGGIMAAAGAAGLSGTQLTVVFGALSLGIGFGLQTIVANFISGLILIFERPIKVGDRLQTGEHFGEVMHIGIRASTIRRIDGADVVVPNSDLITKEVVNWTRTDDLRRVEVEVGVKYGTDPETVLEILRHVADDHPQVLADPPTQPLMISFGDSSLNFQLIAWTDMESFRQVRSDLHVLVNRELRAAGIEIPFPQRDLHMKTAAPEPEDARPAGPVNDHRPHE